MNLQKIRNSVESVVADVESGFATPDMAVDNIVSIFIVEQWDGTRGRLDIDDLTDEDFRIVTNWLVLNRRPYGFSQIALIRDLRGVFPGLSIAAAAWIVRGK